MNGETNGKRVCGRHSSKPHMRIVFVGVGEAFDGSYPNNSHLVIGDTTLLLDCGYSVPGQLWRYDSDPELIDGIYVSHGHADHYFGLPAVLTRMWEDERERPLTIICQRGLTEKIRKVIDLGYSGIPDKFRFDLRFTEIGEGDRLRFNELELSFAPTEHSVSNLAVGVSDGNNRICYSGDGRCTEKCEQMYKGVDLVIHEAYTFDKPIPGHGCVTDLTEMARRNNIKCLALTHIRRDCRRNEMDKIKEHIAGKDAEIIVPRPSDMYEL